MLADLDLVTDNSNLPPSHCEAVSIIVLSYPITPVLTVAKSLPARKTTLLYINIT